MILPAEIADVDAFTYAALTGISLLVLTGLVVLGPIVMTDKSG